MVILSDRDIRKAIATNDILVSDLEDAHIGPCSIDLRLGTKFRVFKHHDITHIDPRESVPDEIMTLVEKQQGEPFIIHPDEFVLGITHERVRIPSHLVGRLDGRSSWGRLGIVIHSTAGSIQPGFEGKITLEISNLSKIPVILTPGVRICQLSFEMLSSPAQNIASSSKYVGQDAPVLSRINLERVGP